MNPKELIFQLERSIHFGRMDDWRVVIPVRRIGSIGGTPCVDIELVTTGFDWDSGKIFLNTKEELRVIGVDEIKALKDEYQELSWKYSQISGLKRENKKLKERIKELESKNET
mgnify:CR=1 FL=1